MKQGFRKMLSMIGLLGAMGGQRFATFSDEHQTEGNTVNSQRSSANSFGMHNPIYIPNKGQRIKAKRLAKRNANR